MIGVRALTADGNSRRRQVKRPGKSTGAPATGIGTRTELENRFPSNDLKLIRDVRSG